MSTKTTDLETRLGGRSRLAKISPYIVAIVLCSAATVARFALAPVLHERSPFVTYFVAIMLTAWYGGFFPAMLALVISTIIGSYYFVGPPNTLFSSSWPDQLAIWTFVFIGTVTALICESLIQAQKRERSALERFKEAITEQRTLADFMPQIVWTAGRDGTLDYFNKQWHEFTGLSEDARGWKEAIHGDDANAWEKAWARAIRNGQPLSQELRLKNGQTGSFRWHLCRALPIRDSEGSITKWFGTCTDIDDLKRAQQALEFLAQSGETLSRSMDYEETLQIVAGLAVPSLADWCAVDILEDGELKQVAVVHTDPEKVEMAREFRRRYPPDKDAPQGLWNVVRTGESEIYADIPPEMIEALSRSDEEREFARQLNLVSALVVPLVAHDKTLGALTFIQAESGRQYTEEDLRFAELIAKRCATAVDNARLFKLAQDEVSYRLKAETEQTELAVEINRQRKRLNDILATVPGVVWEAWGKPDEKTQRIDFVSDHVEPMLGYSVQEWLETPNFWLRIVHPDDREKAAREAAEKFQSGKPGVSAFRWVRKDGRPIWVEARSVSITDEQGQPIGMRGVTMDVTERKQAEDALRFLANASEALAGALDYESTLQRVAQLAVPGFADWCVVYTVDGSGVITRAATAFQSEEQKALYDKFVQKWDATKESKVGYVKVIRTAEPDFLPEVPDPTSGSSLTHEANRELVARMQLQSYICVPIIARGRALGALSFVTKTPGRKYTQADLTLAELLAKRAAIAIDNALLFRNAQIEIAERELAQQMLKESQERLQAILDNSPTAIYVKDIEGRYTLVNRECEQLLNKTRDKILGSTDFDLFPSDIAAELRKNDRLIVESKQPLEVEESASFFGASAQTISVKFPLLDESGNVYAVCGITTDITERKRLEEQLQQAQKMESVGRLAGGVAHDFNNLLTAVIGYAELAEMKLGENHPTAIDVQQIKRAGERAAKLTSQLLAFARKQVVEPKVLDLNELSVQLNDMLRRLIGEDIELVTKTARELWAVRADPGQIEQVLVNLIVNARDAMPSGGTITIETANVSLDRSANKMESGVPPGNYVMLAVSDTGSGMDEKLRENIFEPFFTTKEKGKGTGLGLATCYGIVKQSGGHIWVYSEPGMGTTFKIYLPRIADRSILQQIEEIPEPVSFGQATVLLAEDEEAVRQLVVTGLEQLGYEVLQAANGYDALKISREYSGNIDLLITDVVMPQVGGRELAERILTDRPDTKVLFISGYTEGVISQHGNLERGVDFLQKPFTPAQLAVKVREILDADAKVERA